MPLLPTLLSLALLPRAVQAETRCVSVDAFRTWMQTHEATDSLTLRFDVTGVNPADFPNTKGALADFSHTACPEGAGNVIKVYGPAEPVNEAHPAGTLKQEYGYACGPTAGEETWASPNPSEVVFTDGSERCDVTMWLDPLTFGYRLDCDHGLFEAEGENTPQMPVDHIELFALSDGSTWRMEHARSTWNEVCFEAGEDAGGQDDGGQDSGAPADTGGAGGGTLTLEAAHDVTVAVDHPDVVYADPDDLCVEAGYAEVYLMFDLRGVPGRITEATLHLDARADGSANGSGAAVYAVADTSWDEDTLSWNARPGGSGAALDRIGPIAPSEVYALDVGAALSTPDLVAFALIPAATDTDGAHFESVEGAPGRGPRLVLRWEPVEEEEGGGADSGDGGSGDGGSGGPRGGVAPGERVPTGCGCAAGAGAGPGALSVLGLLLVGRRGRKGGGAPRRSHGGR